jgi:hypothetical protein
MTERGVTMTFMSTTGQSPAPPAGAAGAFGALRMTPGRWVALAIGVPVALALIGWTGFSLVAATARGSYPFSLPVPVQDGQVAVNVTAGNITLRPGSGGAAQLTGTVQYGLIRPSIMENTTPTGTNLGVNCGGIGSGNCGVSASLDVPARTAVTLWSNGGDIQASGFSSGVTLWAEGGNVTASNLAGDLRLDTGGGDLTSTGLTGALTIGTEGGNVNAGDWVSSGTMYIDTGGGDLTADGLTGNLQVAAEGGNVYATGVASEVADVDSGGGNVTLTFTKVPQNLRIAAEGGTVTVVLPPGGTKYDISTPDTAGGNVYYPSSLFSSKSPHTITIDSGGGDITVSQG